MPGDPAFPAARALNGPGAEDGRVSWRYRPRQRRLMIPMGR